MTHEGIALQNQNRQDREKQEKKSPTEWDGSSRGDQGSLQNNSPLPVPPVFKGEGGKGPVTVDGMALKHFAAAVKELLPHLRNAVRDVDSLAIRAGNFKHGNAIRDLITGPTGNAGLKKEYSDALKKMGAAFEKFVAGVEELAAKYQTTEELNSKGANDVADLMKQFGAGIPGVAGGP
ncbi:hypothetical protein [Streptoalloteichus hindustanus]|uniref:Excreted virulence factor EspC, type VII ESX diderm n=1 Tax=Streptoalloteichus hindustanus TaxID=2017 RepID=A0A1M5PW73_STRHI|nr:hypothetical protein [Streptoalloteichus hindustanus]SHH05942.1 hypothetical protein SAMN05444320_12020 [Streptoalloteichus hindustanus]